MSNPCVSADEAEAVYAQLVTNHPSPHGYLACDDQAACDLCRPLAHRLDVLADECEARGCVEGRCVYEVVR